MEGSLSFKIDWASLIVGSKSSVFALFYFVFEGNFPSKSPWRPYIRSGHLTEGFLRYRFGGLIFGGAYTYRGLFSEFYCIRNYEYTFDTESCTGSSRLESHIQLESYHRRKTPTRNLA